MSHVELAEGVYWVGAIDWNIRNFHGYTTPRGTTYNAYLIVDEKIALIDTVKAPFAAEMLDRIGEIVDPSRIDYMVSNHVEMDHSGAIPEVLRRSQATVVTAERGKKGLTRVYKSDWPFQVVKEGDELPLGRRRLQFIEAPMLHWPDNILAYLPEQQILFSSDAFGQHIASSWRYADQVPYVFSEAAKYYANIVMPYASMVLRALEKLEGKGIELVAPSHGLLWRGPELQQGIQAYTDWSQGVARDKVLICYDSMWGSTDKMARALLEGIVRGGVEVSLYNLTLTDWSETIKEVLDAKAVLIGSPTLNKGLFPTVAGFLAYLKGLKPKGKLGASFGSYGWSGGAVTAANQELKAAGIEVIDSGLEFSHVPDSEELEKCVAFGEKIAQQVKSR
ncbi:MAG: FprA family A-type flavoprotein [Candidatus Tectomicrobia bacterium]|uniref:FprA family A-type flavoprotein n=1 Tax=Tectimicrobiota bacterium TaxID=2528274 RepID=A0A932CMJ1_UNCTE|nr:FprA family A-type flavoprotein [Candidatus Tectomicrobia bacterium]